jgi:hypothetical protein
MPSSRVIEALDLFLTELASVLREAKCMIGHIKGYLTFDNGGAMGLSIVKKTVNHKEVNYDPLAPSKGFKLALTNIVFKVSETELRRLVELGLGIALPKTLVEAVPAEKTEKSEETAGEKK